MRVMIDEKILIYCAMTRGNNSGLLEGLTTEKDTIDNFVEWLRCSFWSTQGQQRMSFQSLRQGANESEMFFFIRCEKGYFRSRGMAKPIETKFSQYMKENIRHGFLMGHNVSCLKKWLGWPTDLKEQSGIGWEPEIIMEEWPIFNFNYEKFN